MKQTNTFSVEAIIELRGRASHLATAHRSAADELGGEISLIDSLLAVHCAGPSNDARLALIATGRRLSALVENSGGPTT